MFVGNVEVMVGRWNHSEWFFRFFLLKFFARAVREGSESWMAGLLFTVLRLAATNWLVTGLICNFAVSFNWLTSCHASTRPGLISWLCSWLNEIMASSQIIRIIGHLWETPFWPTPVSGKFVFSLFIGLVSVQNKQHFDFLSFVVDKICLFGVPCFEARWVVIYLCDVFHYQICLTFDSLYNLKNNF